MSFPRNERKVVLVGESGVGKTSIFERISHNLFDMTIAPTVGAGCCPHTVVLKEQSVRLNLWDTAGQEKFSTLVPLYLRNAEAVILVFDASASQNTSNLSIAHENLRESVRADIPLFLVANKMDIVGESFNDATFMTWADNNQATFCKTSAKTGVGLEELFALVAQSIVDANLTQKRTNEILKEICETETESHGGCC
jgi:small GTP-binding protein